MFRIILNHSFYRRLKYQQSRVRGSATKSKIIRSDDEMETPPRNSQNTECKVIRSDDELDTPPPTSVSKRNALQSKGNIKNELKSPHFILYFGENIVSAKKRKRFNQIDYFICRSIVRVED